MAQESLWARLADELGSGHDMHVSTIFLLIYTFSLYFFIQSFIFILDSIVKQENRKYFLHFTNERREVA